MLARPGPAAVIDDPLAQQQFRHPMPCGHQVTAAILAGTHQVTGGFLLDAGNGHRHDLTQMQQPRQMPGITGVGLDPIPRRALQLRRRGHHTLDPRIDQIPRQPEPRRAGLIGHRHRRRQTTGSSPRSLRDSGSTAAETPHRFPGPTHTRPPIVRAHPTRHSYAESSLGPPTSVALPARTTPVGNPRSHVSEAPAPHTVYTRCRFSAFAAPPHVRLHQHCTCAASVRHTAWAHRVG